MQTSAGKVDQLLDIWAAHALLEGRDGEPIFHTHQELLDTIDAIKIGDAPFQSFSVCFPGPVNSDSPDWKHRKWTVYARNTQVVVHQLIDNPEANGKFNTRPYIEIRDGKVQVYSNLMSGDWAYRQAVRNLLLHLFLTSLTACCPPESHSK